MCDRATTLCGDPAFPAPFVEETVLFSVECSSLPCQILADCTCMGLFLGSQLCCTGWHVCFKCQYHTVLIIIALLCKLQIRKRMPPALFFLPFQDYFGCLVSFVVLWDQFFDLCEKCFGFLIVNALNKWLWIVCLFLTILLPLIHEQKIPFHLFVFIFFHKCFIMLRKHLLFLVWHKMGLDFIIFFLWSFFFFGVLVD